MIACKYFVLYLMADSEGRFMVAVGAIIENEHGQVLLLQRNKANDFGGEIWEYISGRMKQFESPEEALKREVFEEVGIKDIQIIKPVSVFHIFRGEKVAEKELVGIVYWVKTKQKEIRISEEHTDYKWVSRDDALTLITHPGVKQDFENFLNNC